MKLTFEQIKKVAVGTVEIAENDGVLYFYRSTAKQREVWKGMAGNSSGSTGVRLDFHTNSRKVVFNAPYGGKFELYIDGLLRQQYPADRDKSEPIVAEAKGIIGEELDEYRVTLYFPNHDEGGAISSVEVDDGAFVRPHDFDMKMLFIGDSITQGWESKYDTLAYAQRVSMFFNADSIIQGIGGIYFRIKAYDKIDYEPDAVIISLGTNDFNHFPTLDDMRVQVSGFLDLLCEDFSDKKVFIISPIWRALKSEESYTRFAACRDVVISEAERRGLIHIDGLTLMPPIPALFADKVLHPNDLGFSVYSENLIKALQKYL
ncbi:MAG: SGNH/GDSL hydrolase family protein [Clostridia bacterium]|nr:SGNH/GDSL hydrolase family protein [Clostridia bacterium]